MIELYIWQRCPFCQKVLRAAEEMGLKEGSDFTVIDAAPGTSGRLTVHKIGGKTMVPFLVHNEASMYESDDIVAYLKNLSQ